jgi:hypothetical protein
VALIGLGAAAEALLQLVVSTAAAEGIALPERQHVTTSAGGNEAWDCEQVVVGLLQFNPSNAAGGNSGEWAGPALTAGGSVSLPEAYLRVEIVRAVPQVTNGGRSGKAFPDSADEHAAGLAAMTDAALLHRVRALAQTGAALTAAKASDIRLGPIVPSGAEGGLASMSLVIGVTLL